MLPNSISLAASAGRQIAEDKAIVENQYPEDLPLDIHAEAHFPTDHNSINYRKGLTAMGLGRGFTA